MFRRKIEEPTWEEKIRAVIDVLSELDPKQIEEVATLAKEQRVVQRNIDAFIGTESKTENSYEYKVPSLKEGDE